MATPKRFLKPSPPFDGDRSCLPARYSAELKILSREEIAPSGLREALARAAGAESFAALEKQLVRTQVAVLDLFKATISDPAEKAE